MILKSRFGIMFLIRVNQTRPRCHLLMCMFQNYFKNRNPNIKEIYKQENANSQQSFVVFLAGTDSENKIT